MTGISKFLLTGLGGIGVVTATGYGVYYDANNKKIEKSKKDEDFKTESLATNINENKSIEETEELSDKPNNKETSQKPLVQEEQQQKVVETSQESDGNLDISPTSFNVDKPNGNSSIDVQEQDQKGIESSEEQEVNSQVENNDEKSEKQKEKSDTEEEKDTIRTSVSSSGEEATLPKSIVEDSESLSPSKNK